MDENAQILAQMGMGYTPMFGGTKNPLLTGLENTPFFGSSPVGQMVGSMLANPLMDRLGMFPAGAGTNRNLHDTMRRMQLTRLQRQAVADAGHLDAANYYDSFRGVSDLFGVEFGPDQQKAAAALSSRAASLAPILGSIRPDLLEQLGGSRGSASVLAQRLAESGRYRIDAATGSQGLTRESLKGLTEGIYRDIAGPDGAHRYGGLMAGQLGELASGLQARGIAPGGGSDFTGGVRTAARQLGALDPEELKAAGKRRGVNVSGNLDALSAGDLDKLSGDETVAARLRTVDLDRTKRMLKDYSKAVGVMKEIFGDMGRPNAPVAELLNGLDSLTAGQTGRLAPERLAEIARRTQTLAQQAGVPVQQAVTMQSTFAEAAARMGLDPSAAVDATQAALAFGTGLQQSGAMNTPVWNRKSLDQQAQMAGIRTLHAAKSQTAASLGAVIAQSNLIGGYEAGSNADRLEKAIRNREDFFVDTAGNRKSVAMYPEEIAAMVAGTKTKTGGDSGITEAGFNKIAAQGEQMNEVIQGHGIAQTVMRAQSRMARPMFVEATSTSMVDDLSRALQKKGMTPEAAHEAASKAVNGGGAEAAANAFLRKGTSAAEGNLLIGNAVLGSLPPEMLAGMTTDERKILAKTIGSNSTSALDRFARNSQFGMSAADFQTQYGDHTKAGLERQYRQARATDAMKSAFEGLGPEEPMRNFIDALKDTRSSDSNALSKIIGRTMGGTGKPEVEAKLTEAAREFQKKRESLQTKIREIESLPEADKHAALEAIVNESRELKVWLDKIQELSKNHGLLGQGTSVFKLPAEALEAARQTRVDQTERAQDLMLGNSEASKKAIATALATADPIGSQGLTKYQQLDLAMTVAAARKKKMLENIRDEKPNADGLQETQDELAKTVWEAAGTLPGDPAENRKKALDVHFKSMGPQDKFIKAQMTALLDKNTGRLFSEDEAKAYVKGLRGLRSPRATTADVAAVQGRFGKNVSPEEATQLANLAAEARMQEIPDAEIRDLMEAGTGSEKIAALAAKVDAGNVNRFEGGDIAGQSAAMAKGFKDSETEEGTRQAQQRAETEVSRFRNLSSALNVNPEYLLKDEKGSLASADKIDAALARVTALAKQHAEGSMSNFMQGNYTWLKDIKTPEQVAEYVRVREEGQSLFRGLDAEALKASALARAEQPKLTPEQTEEIKKRARDRRGTALVGDKESPGAGLLADFGFDPSKLSAEEKTHLEELDRQLDSDFGRGMHKNIHEGIGSLKKFGVTGQAGWAEGLSEFGVSPGELNQMQQAFDSAKSMGGSPGAVGVGPAMDKLIETLNKLENGPQARGGPVEIKGSLDLNMTTGLACVTGSMAPNRGSPA